MADRKKTDRPGGSFTGGGKRPVKSMEKLSKPYINNDIVRADRDSRAKPVYNETKPRRDVYKDEPVYEERNEREANIANLNGAKRKASGKIRRRAGKSEVFVLTVSFILFLVSIGGSLFKFATKEKVATMTVPFGSVDVPREVKGIIVRDETVYKSSAAGNVVYNVVNNEKVKNGAVVCSIDSAEDISSLEEKSLELSRKIIEMQNMREDVSAVASDVSVINSKIKAEVDSNLMYLSSGDYSYLYKLKDGVLKDMRARNDKLLSEDSGAVKSIVDEYRQYTGEIEESRTPVAINKGGLVSYVIDGLEDTLTVDKINEITKDQTEMNVSEDAFVQVSTVNAEDNVFKIIESNEWYIASYISNDLTADWSEGGDVKLMIEKDGAYLEHTFKLTKLTKGSEESFAVFMSDKQLLDFINLRTVKFKTYDSVYEGIKIPETAICERAFLKIPAAYVSESKGSTVVYKKSEAGLEQVVINTKFLRNAEAEENSLYVLQDFDNIRIGDVIVTSEEDETGYMISELVSSKGVFRTNTGLATFVSVSLDGIIMGGKGYVILDSEVNNSNNGLKIHDRIVTDTVNSFIKEGDIVN